MVSPDKNGPTTAPDQKPDEVSLEEIDRILEDNDPEFTKSLGEIKEIGVEPEVEIESAVQVDESLPTEEEKAAPAGLLARWPWLEKVVAPFKRLRAEGYTRYLRFKASAIIGARQALLLSRTLPVEFFRYLKAQAKRLVGLLTSIVQGFRDLSLRHKAAWMALIILSATTLLLIRLNISGIWLPGLFSSVITDMTTVADRVWSIPPDEESVMLYRAFPQDEIEFLFPKVVVNLKRTSARNPMGAFEFFVVLDSEDAALEVKARARELHDRLQRALEGLTYEELSSPMGRLRLKEILRKELNDHMSQGWTKDILIKTMILKP